MCGEYGEVLWQYMVCVCCVVRCRDSMVAKYCDVVLYSVVVWCYGVVCDDMLWCGIVLCFYSMVKLVWWCTVVMVSDKVVYIVVMVYSVGIVNGVVHVTVVLSVWCLVCAGGMVVLCMVA